MQLNTMHVTSITTVIVIDAWTLPYVQRAVAEWGAHGASCTHKEIESPCPRISDWLGTKTPLEVTITASGGYPPDISATVLEAIEDALQEAYEEDFQAACAADDQAAAKSSP